MLTISRIVSCPIIAYAIVQGHFGLATSLLGLAGVTDWVRLASRLSLPWLDLLLRSRS